MTTNKILIVDDDRTTRKVIELQLKNMGYEVIDSADTANDAIEKVEHNSPQLVLMDINLGKGMDGIETARQIMEKYHIPVVFITAYGTSDNLERAKKVNPAGFINKPVRENDLHANIEIALQRQTLFDTLAEGTPAYKRKKPKPLQITSNEEGKINKPAARVKEAVENYKLESIYELLPDDHTNLVKNCLKHQKPQMLTGKIGDHIISWEYQPMQAGDSIRILIVDISDQYDTAILNSEESSLSEALDHLASGVMLVNEHMKIFYKNKSTEKLFKGNSILTNENGYLGCKTPELTAELHHLILKDTGDTLTISRGEKKPPLHIFVSPLHSRSSNYGHDLPIAVVFVFETVNDTERIGDVIRTLYNLSPSEAKIAAMLVFNPHLEEVAKSLGITYNTARTHLKRIYLKTGTNRMSSLVHRIMTGPVGILIHSRD